MAYKLLDMAQARWRRLDGAHLLPIVRAGITFVDGVQQTTRGRGRNDHAARTAYLISRMICGSAQCSSCCQ